MISKGLLWTIFLGVIGVVIVAWHMGTLPARVVIINQSGAPLRNVVVDAGGSRYEIGGLDNGESRRIAIDPAEELRLTFSGTADRIWTAPDPLTAGQSLVVYVTPGDHIVSRNRIGALAR